jgi:oxygen-dependent protoporphyrinogen oxidase
VLGVHRNIAIAGAAVDGVGIAACIASGQRAADTIAASVKLANRD